MRCVGDEFMVNIRFYFSFSTRFSVFGFTLERRYTHINFRQLTAAATVLTAVANVQFAVEMNKKYLNCDDIEHMSLFVFNTSALGFYDFEPELPNQSRGE